jgi:hypothetical protein
VSSKFKEANAERPTSNVGLKTVLIGRSVLGPLAVLRAGCSAFDVCSHCLHFQIDQRPVVA